MNKNIIIHFFRYLWIAIAIVIIFFILSQAFYTQRTLEYNLNFSEAISKNIRGWYPEQRLTNVSVSSIADAYDVVAEPLYMKIYIPIDFETMNIQGSLQANKIDDIKLGLKQVDGSWDYKQVLSNDIDLKFDLTNAQIINNQLEIILSAPGLINPERISLQNNWQIILAR